jgi:hypothetical protein
LLIVRLFTWIFDGPPASTSTPCKCYGSITGRWRTGRRLRGTGLPAPKVCLSIQDRETLAEMCQSCAPSSMMNFIAEVQVPSFPNIFERVMQSPDLTPSGTRFEGCGKGHDLFPGCPMNESADTPTEKPGRALQKRPFAVSGTR